MDIDLRTLCLALGFTIVVTHGHGMIRRKGEATRRALVFARLIEEFCLEQVREPAEPSSAEGPMAIVTRMAEAIIEVLKVHEGQCRADDLLAKGFTHEQIERHSLLEIYEETGRIDFSAEQELEAAIDSAKQERGQGTCPKSKTS